jgi:hypothetical protein
MKTAKEYLYTVMGCEPVNSRIDYVDALEAVQAAIDDAGSVRQQVREALAEYFEPLLPDPTPQPITAPPIRSGERTFFESLPCSRCGMPARTCGCEQPPF